jgi:hypothetical protein
MPKGKVVLLLAITFVMAVVETAMTYILRTRGPMPFRIRLLPDFAL